MIIRCPKCEHTRSISENKIPPMAELATCPRCKHRFRFRTLPHPLDIPAPQTRRPAPPRAETASSSPKMLSPQSAVRESAQCNDIWDAVDALHQQWQNQLDQHVAEVESPMALASRAAAAKYTTGSVKDTKDATAAEVAAQNRNAGADTANAMPEPESFEQTGKRENARQAIAAPVQAQDSPAQQETSSTGHTRTDDARADQARDFHAGSGGTANTSLQQGRDKSEPANGNGAKESLPGSGDAEEPAAPAPVNSDFAQTTTGETAQGSPDHSSPARRTVADNAAQSLNSADNEPAPRVLPFSYCDGSPKPEERVEHDLQMLRQEPPARPLRDLGKLREFADSVHEEEKVTVQPGEIPWENPAKYGWGKAFMRTILGVMFNAPVLFSTIRAEGSLAPGYLFFLALGYIGIIATVAWLHIAALLLPGVFSMPDGLITLPLLLLLAPVALGLMLLFVTSLIKMAIMFFDPEKAVFPSTYRIVSYSVAPFVLCITPFVGPAIGAVWFFAALVLGCRHGLGLSWSLSFSAPLFPALALLGGLIVYFL